MKEYTIEENIIYLCLLIFICIFAAICCYFISKCAYIKSKKQREYLKTLNNREKAVIAEYLHINAWPSKKKKNDK